MKYYHTNVNWYMKTTQNIVETFPCVNNDHINQYFRQNYNFITIHLHENMLLLLI